MGFGVRFSGDPFSQRPALLSRLLAVENVEVRDEVRYVIRLLAWKNSARGLLPDCIPNPPRRFLGKFLDDARAKLLRLPSQCLLGIVLCQSMQATACVAHLD